MTLLCQYKDIFGKPGTGVHQMRLPGNFALMDTIPTILLALLINWGLSGGWKGLFISLIFVFTLSILIHRLFCVKTTLTNYFFD